MPDVVVVQSSDAFAAWIATCGPDWASIMTAFGTVAAAAVSIALWAERRAGIRIKAEHGRADKLLTDERAHGRALLKEERRSVAIVLADGERHLRRGSAVSQLLLALQLFYVPARGI